MAIKDLTEGLRYPHCGTRSMRCISLATTYRESRMDNVLIERGFLLPAVFLGFFGGLWLQIVGGVRVMNKKRFGQIAKRSGIGLMWASLLVLLTLWNA
jgi:hypothetical protein